MRLIDADELIPSLKMGEVNADTAYGDGRNGGIYFAIWRIGQMPTIDAVPIVRCKNCKNLFSCYKWPTENILNNFCQDGEFGENGYETY